MKIPVDIRKLSFVALGEPQAVIDFSTKAPRLDAEGRQLFSVDLASIASDGAEVYSVKVAGQAKGVTPGVTVSVSGLVATTWSMGDRSGVSFRADAIEVMSPATVKA
jgi:hypothetical protein